MNKQEIKEQVILAIKDAIGNNVSFVDESSALVDCDDVDHIAEQSADELIEAGYINGADFVEWLKSKYADLYYLDTFNRQDVFEIDQALQEYLKGE